MTIYSIYKATNIVNGKSYIGFTKDFSRRKAQHIGGSRNPQLYFHYAIRKYGIDNFRWEIICQSKNGQHLLEEMEPHFIREYDTFKNGYNQSYSIEGQKIISDEGLNTLKTKMLGDHNPMKNITTRNKVSDSIIKLHNEGVYKNSYTDERSRKISKSKLGPKNPMYGNHNAASHMNVKTSCTKCGMVTTIGNIKRWHNENCRS